MKLFSRRFLAALAGGMLLAACAPGAQPIDNPQALVQTIAAATIAARPSNTPYPTLTASPAPGLPPVEAPAAGSAVPSLTIFPTLTTFPTLPQPSTLPAVLSGGGYLLFSPTPEPWKCFVEHTSPEWGAEFTPRYIFKVNWRIFNTGGRTWKADAVHFKYLGGMNLNNAHERDDEFLPISIYPGDKILIHLGFTAPREPGTYTSNWGLVNAKNEIFCTASITIRVKSK